MRTYVRDARGRAGVWFFSLDAASRLAVFGARRFWHLNYLRARIGLVRSGEVTSYSVDRVVEPPAKLEVDWEAGPRLPAGGAGALGGFLTERYALFARDRRGRLWHGRIWHEPWPLQDARVLALDGDLVPRSTGLPAAMFASEPLAWHVEHLAVDAWPLREATLD